MDLCKNVCFCFIFIFLFAIFPLEAKNHRGDKLRNGRQGPTISSGVQKAAEMCDKYTRQACGAPPPPNSGARIVGGNKVYDNRFPHMATLGNPTGNDDWYCGASLISEEFLITAAHCLFDEYKQREQLHYVRMGDLDLKTHTDDEHVIVGKVVETFVNPWFNVSAGDYFADLALIKIQPIQFTDWVRPICLNANRNIPNVSLSITGWGYKKENGKSSQRLRVADIYQVDYMLCKNQNNSYYDDKIEMCAGIYGGGKDACEGDSGGPMQMPVNNLQYGCNVPIWSLVGLVSNGDGCGRPMTPTTYTRISYFVDWIAGMVW